MSGPLSLILGFAFPIVAVVLLVLVGTRKDFPGKPWFMAYLGIGLFTMIGWRLPGLVYGLGFEGDWAADFYDYMRVPLQILGFLGYGLLFPFVFSCKQTQVLRVTGGVEGDQQMQADTSHPLYGVRGWLKFFVVMHLYVVPVLFVIIQVAGFFAISMVTRRYPGLMVVGVIQALIGGFLIVRWILISLRLRDRAPRVIQEVKLWLWISLGCNLVSSSLIFFAGLDPDKVVVDAARGLSTGVIGFMIWYAYFTKSKRVKATYPDWDQP